MQQGLVMTIAFQICTEVVFHDVDDYTFSFDFQTEENVNDFIAELEAFEGVSLVRSNLSVIVMFTQD